DGTADPRELVDVVCLSLGYFAERPAAELYTGCLAAIIDRLRALGVLVVAAAGNYATSREFFPAALAGRPPDSIAVPLLSFAAPVVAASVAAALTAGAGERPELRLDRTEPKAAQARIQAALTRVAA